MLLEWISGGGWLVFAAQNSADSAIRAQALARMEADGGVAYISLADDGGDALLDDMEDLGAPTGYMIDIEIEDSTTIRQQLKDISMIVLESGTSLDALARALRGPVVDALREAYERGALILVEGLAVNLFGRWSVSDSGRIFEGLDWLKNVFIEPNVTSLEESRAVQMVLQAHPQAIALEIGAGSALALGVGGQVEVWGAGQVTVALGSHYA
jgi:hypothetical protein